MEKNTTWLHLKDTPFDSIPSKNELPTSLPPQPFPWFFWPSKMGAPPFGGTNGLSKTHGKCGKKQGSTALATTSRWLREKWVQKTPNYHGTLVGLPKRTDDTMPHTPPVSAMYITKPLVAWTFGMLCQRKAKLFWCIPSPVSYKHYIYIWIKYICICNQYVHIVCVIYRYYDHISCLTSLATRDLLVVIFLRNAATRNPGSTHQLRER